MPQKSNTSDKTLNEDILKELKNINSQLLNLNNKIEESNLLARESKSNEDATHYTDQVVVDGGGVDVVAVVGTFGDSVDVSCSADIKMVWSGGSAAWCGIDTRCDNGAGVGVDTDVGRRDGTAAATTVDVGIAAGIGVGVGREQ
ncbi:Hypothetical predicted protein [Octopus vulgaris]|uniref:Uncharacterized protein n=1 Tax=Octopus vulgaris TaxID=6645 RepID=A0AA36B0T1_OCTVU|nr:Hypothetical predicted protein [Octopus vulgaris]